ncbi:hypothetical protein [Roseibium sp.]|uniref:hypothetical protein n=1 Tax=Roseibium sp. TaxID=1936156 RepID=UPI003A9878CF
MRKVFNILRVILILGTVIGCTAHAHAEPQRSPNSTFGKLDSKLPINRLATAIPPGPLLDGVGGADHSRNFVTKINQSNSNRDVVLSLVAVHSRKLSKKVMLQKDDDTFVFVSIQQGRGRSTPVAKYPEGDDFWKFRKKNTITSDLGKEVWWGPLQTITVSAQLRKYNHAKKNLTSGLFVTSGIVGAVGVTVISGGAAAAIGAGLIGYGSSEAVNLVKKKADKFSYHLGTVNQTLELKRATDLIGKPNQKVSGMRYHFKTDHSGHGGKYTLYWRLDWR